MLPRCAQNTRPDCARRKKRLWAGSHEINNALAPITGYTELLSLNPTITADDLLVTFARRILWASVDVTE